PAPFPPPRGRVVRGRPASPDTPAGGPPRGTSDPPRTRPPHPSDGSIGTLSPPSSSRASRGPARGDSCRIPSWKDPARAPRPFGFDPEVPFRSGAVSSPVLSGRLGIPES